MKIKLLIALIFSSAIVVAQSLSIVGADTSKTTGDANSTDELVGYLTVKNNSSKDIDVLGKRIDKGYNNLTDSNAICWGGACWPTTVTVSLGHTTIPAGQTNSPGDVFSAHVYPDGDGVNHKGPITYVFYDKENPSDSVAVTIFFEVDNTFSIGSVGLKTLQVDVFPNPASKQLSVNYSIPGKEGTFKLVNVVGKQVYSRSINQSSGEFKLDISKLSRGVYFYMLQQEGKAVLTRKLVVQ